MKLMLRIIVICLLSFSFTSCVNLGSSGKSGTSFFKLFNSYQAALNDYEKGLIMKARQRILAIEKTDEDYKKARRLLKRKVEPKRKHSLKRYQQKAQAAETDKNWSKAMGFYAQAASFSTRPAALQKKQQAMEIRLRQLRMNKLLADRRSEDSLLLLWLNHYDVPKGVAANDEVFADMRYRTQNIVNQRSELAYESAAGYLDDDLPEIAYIEAESYLRLNPDSEKAQLLLKDSKKAMPKSLYIAKVKSKKKKVVKLTKRIKKPKSVTKAQINALLKKREWLKAKRFATVYRREGGKGADRILRNIQANIEKDASALFFKGRTAFRQEKLDQAVGFWGQAVGLMPNHAEYVEALNRAEQLQKRLQVLKKDQASEKTQ